MNPNRQDAVVQAAPPRATRIRTRLLASEQDDHVLRALGVFLGHLLNADLAAVCANPHASWKTRKHAITASTSSRWAGAITKTAHAMYRRARAAQQTTLARRTSAIRTIRKRLALPLVCDEATTPGGQRRPRLRGYYDPHERAMKQRRLRILEARATRLQNDRSGGHVHVCRGGKALARHRYYLEDAGLTHDEWRTRWQASRLFIHANGEAGKRFGNETVRVFPATGGMLAIEIDLPPALTHFANAPRGRYRLRAKPFACRAEEWLDHIKAHRACAYDVAYNVEKNRWYLDASFRAEPPVVPDWETLRGMRGARVLAVDLNGNHLATIVLDMSGNPCGAPISIPLRIHGLPVSTRDGRLRAALSQILTIACAEHCCAIVCENLDFEHERGVIREEAVHPKPVRARIMGIPTRQFRERLVAMASRHGLAVIGVPPEHSTEFGKTYWLSALKDVQPTATGHHASAVVLGRRAQGHGARRRGEKTAPHQRMEAGRAHTSVRSGGPSPRPSTESCARGLGPPQRRPGRGRPHKTGAGNGSADGAQGS